MESREKVANIAFYRFADIQDPQGLSNALRSACLRHHLKGTILIAAEGINAMLAGERAAVERFCEELKSAGPQDALIKWSYSTKIPFKRLLVKVKKEILTDRAATEVKAAKPKQAIPPYLKPEDLHQALLAGEEIVLIDIRNDFEVKYGAFKNAINPATKSFSEFSKFALKLKNALEIPVDAKIVTYCTGGIRCEKGARHLLAAGFENVYQLEGGILEYLKRTSGEFFEGSCFVFDERIALDHKLKSVSPEFEKS